MIEIPCGDFIVVILTAQVHRKLSRRENIEKTLSEWSLNIIIKKKTKEKE